MGWYNTNEGVTLTGKFRNRATGVLFDPPDPITFRVSRPTTGETNYVAIRDSLGVYHCDVTITESGDWTYRLEGGGGVGEAMLNVRKTVFS